VAESTTGRKKVGSTFLVVIGTPNIGRNAMLKQVEIKGQSFELYSADRGRTWSSSARSLVAYERRKKTVRSKLQESFQHIGEMQDAAHELNKKRYLGAKDLATRQHEGVPPETPDADFKLILFPCLCDLNEIRVWTQASTASKSPR
jgi:hypothetical protein